MPHGMLAHQLVDGPKQVALAEHGDVLVYILEVATRHQQLVALVQGRYRWRMVAVDDAVATIEQPKCEQVGYNYTCFTRL